MSRRLIENVFSLSVLQAANYVFPLLLMPYLARVLGPEKLGVMAFALGFAYMFVVLTDYGFNLSATREVSVYRNDARKLVEIFIAVTAIRVALMLTGLGVLIILVYLAPKFQCDAPVFFAAYVLVVGNALFPLWLLQGLERLKLASAIQIVAKAVVFGATVLLVKSPDDVALAVLLQGSSVLLGVIFLLPLLPNLLRGASVPFPTRASLIHQLREGWHVFLSTAAINLYTSSNVFFLGLLTSPVAVAYYHVAEKLVRAVQLIFQPVTQAVYPQVSRLAADDPCQALAFNRKMILLLGVAALATSLGLLMAGGLLLELAFGADFKVGTSVVAIMAFLPFIIILSNIFGIQTMLTFGMQRLFSRILVSAAALNFALFIPLAWLYGAEGAALANVAVEVFVTVAMGLTLHRHNRNPLTFEKASV